MKEEPIRIAHILGKMNSGGVESVLMNYYRNIDSSKVQFDFFVDKNSSIPQKNEIEKLGGKIILVPSYKHIFSYIKALKKIFKENKYKIVHSHLNTLSVFPLYAAFRAKVPIRIVHSHSTANWQEWKRTIIKYVLKPFSKFFATDYFACSIVAGKFQFGKKMIEENKVEIIKNAIDIKKFEYQPEVRKNMRKELNIKDDTLIIGNVGRFMEQKNHEFLIEIFNAIHKKYSNSKLLLIGEGKLENKVKSKVKQLGLEQFTSFLGVRNDVNKLYQVMDVFLLPSLYEGLGMVLIEAQIAGCYCVASTEIPKEAQITDSIQFISLNDSTNVWADKILDLSDGYKRKSGGKEAKKNGYDIIVEANKLEKRYINLLEKRK